MDIEMRLKRIGYIVDGIAVDANEALQLIKKSAPDLLLMDIQLGDSRDGILLSKKLQGEKFPIVFLTAFGDSGTFAEALDTEPAGYLLKPFRDDDLQRTIEIALQKAGQKQNAKNENEPGVFFIREKNELIRFAIEEILWLEAMDNYSKVFTSSKTYTIKTFLKDLHEKLPAAHFIRVHRSFIVPLSKISRLEENTLYVGKHAFPIGRQYRDELMQRLRLL
ncbi:MAG: response regulator transcription factor [Bacteroidota bacterium]|nr:response regulator transcription factor [Bacteroidota bacterium]